MSDCTLTGLTGGNYCQAGNPMGVSTGIYFAKSTQKFAAADFLSKAKWAEAIKKEEVFPIRGVNMFKGLEDGSVEVNYFEWGNKTRTVSQQKIPRFTVTLDLNECQKKQINKFRGFRGRIYMEFGNYILGTSDDAGLNIKGAKLTLVNVESGGFTLTDGSKVGTKLVFDLENDSDFHEKGFAFEQGWDTNSLDGLTEMDITVVGTPTATEIKLKVGATCYGKFIHFGGLVAADFTVTGGGSITSVSEANGVYTFVTVGLANDSIIDLVAPSAISEPDYFIKSSGGLVVSGIA